VVVGRLAVVDCVGARPGGLAGIAGAAHAGGGDFISP